MKDHVRQWHYAATVTTVAVLAFGLASCKEDEKRLAAFHEAHQKQELTCDVCHEEVDVEKMTASAVPHETCKVCHEGVPPSSHKTGWDTMHGEESQFGAGMCNYCHKSSECDMCHQITKPKSHNTFWRRRAHGLEAEWDRNRCMVCHQDDFCVRCHSKTKPTSHGPLWAGRQNAHCMFCHVPVSGEENCGVCHVGGALLDRHFRPAPARREHTPGSLCQDCHRPGAGLTHFNTDVSCETCHIQ